MDPNLGREVGAVRALADRSAVRSCQLPHFRWNTNLDRVGPQIPISTPCPFSSDITQRDDSDETLLAVHDGKPTNLQLSQVAGDMIEIFIVVAVLDVVAFRTDVFGSLPAATTRMAISRSVIIPTSPSFSPIGNASASISAMIRAAVWIVSDGLTTRTSVLMISLTFMMASKMCKIRKGTDQAVPWFRQATIEGTSLHAWAS